MMKGFLCMTGSKNDAEYRKSLKVRMRIMGALFIIGIATFFTGLFAEYSDNITLDSHMLGFYSGIGAGIAGAALVLFIRCYRLIRNDELLKKTRIKNSDERILEITRRAQAVAGFVLLMSIYAICLIGGLFYPILIKILLGLAGIFLLTYVITYTVYNRIM